MTESSEKRSSFGVLGFGVAACAACCAGPLLALLGGAAIAGLAGTVFIGASGVVLAVIAAVAFVTVRSRQVRCVGARGAGAVPVTISMRLTPRETAETEGAR